MKNELYTYDDLQTLEQTRPKITGGKFVFGKNTEHLNFIDLSRNNNLREIVFDTPQPELRYLDASRCALGKIRIPAGCVVLQTLYLQKNQLASIVFEGDCPNLELLDISENQLKEFDLPFDFKKLNYLFLEKNKLINLTSLGRFIIRKGFDFAITGNEGMQAPPKQVLKQGKEAVLEWFRQAIEYKTEKVYEAKILIIGEPDAGKTTLRNLLFNEKHPVPLPHDKQPSTLGVHVEPNRYFINPDKTLPAIKAHIWDFGGQDIQYSLHQYFLSDDAVYIMVTDGRSGKTRYGYWFHIINLLGRNSPVLVLLNRFKSQHTIIPFDRSKYSKIFHNLKIVDLGEIDLGNLDHHWRRFIDELASQLSHLNVVGMDVLKPWKSIREELDHIRKNK